MSIGAKNGKEWVVAFLKDRIYVIFGFVGNAQSVVGNAKYDRTLDVQMFRMPRQCQRG
jgi:hypothetical protein